MARLARFAAIIFILQGAISPAPAHQAQEDARGCHFEEAEHHCHDQDADVGAFFAVLSVFGFLTYVFCNRLIDCTDKSGADIPEVPLPEAEVK